MDKRKFLKKIVRLCLIISFTAFLALFLSQKTGYAEYENHRQVALTEKQIKKFEKDVAEGRQLDIKTYLKTNNHNYQNKLSKTGLKLSNFTGNAVKTIVVKSFKFLSKLAE